MRDSPELSELDPVDDVRRHCKKNSPSVLSCIDMRTREGCDRVSEVWTTHSRRDGDLIIYNINFSFFRLKDPTSPYIDHILVIDIIMIMLMAVPLGFICQLVGLPSLFGYVLAGLTLGPSGLNWIQEMVSGFDNLNFIRLSCLSDSVVNLTVLWEIRI